MSTPVWVFDTDNGRISFANDAACELWKAADEAELTARDISADMTVASANSLRQYRKECAGNGAPLREHLTFNALGEPVSVEVAYSGFTLADGRTAMMCEVIRKVEGSPEMVRSTEALQHTDVMILLYCAKGQQLYCNPAAETYLPAGKSHFNDLFAHGDDYWQMKALWEQHGECRRIVELRTGSGTSWFDVSAKTCRDAASGSAATLVTAVDVTELKDARDQARYLADRDQLTGSFNRAYFRQKLNAVSHQNTRQMHSQALLFLDVDRFKQINDTYGHDAGDEVLKVYVERLSACIGKNDMLARSGGDEFVLLLNEVRSRPQLDRQLAAIKQALAKPIQCGANIVSTSASIGAAMGEPGAVCSWSELMKQADIALHDGKREGRDDYTVYDDALGASYLERNWLECEIRKAIDTRAFDLHYQPRLDIRKGEIVSAEALIRWNHPERGNIRPDQFIPLCEEMGLIHEIGEIVVQKACDQVGVWRGNGIEANVSVNVSPSQFENSELVEQLLQVKAKYGFPNGTVELEITESSLFGNDDAVDERIRKIIELGFDLALDDFGTGYSNLARLSQLPLSCIKLDRSFVQQLPDSAPLVKLILTYARQTGAITVAEGVETQEQLNWLAENGCDQMQGYLYCRPMPAAQMDAKRPELARLSHDLLTGIERVSANSEQTWFSLRSAFN